jgi:hypothetical protein
MHEHDMLKDALAAPVKGTLERHALAILELRRKRYTWRAIAAFLNKRGIATDHTKVYRFITKAKQPDSSMKRRATAEYKTVRPPQPKRSAATQKGSVMKDPKDGEYEAAVSFTVIDKEDGPHSDGSVDINGDHLTLTVPVDGDTDWVVKCKRQGKGWQGFHVGDPGDDVATVVVYRAGLGMRQFLGKWVEDSKEYLFHFTLPDAAYGEGA